MFVDLFLFSFFYLGLLLASRWGRVPTPFVCRSPEGELIVSKVVLVLMMPMFDHLCLVLAVVLGKT